MALPITAFWLLNSSVARLMAEGDLRKLTVAPPSNSEEYIAEVRKHLVIEMGTTFKLEGSSEPVESVMDAERDEAGFNDLRAMLV